jgi:hypothetical protein
MMNQACRIVAVVLGIALTVTLTAVRADAQSSEARTFGPTSEVSYTVPAWQLVGHSDLDPYGTVEATRHCKVVDCFLETGVLLPAGAVVTSIEVDGCDSVGQAAMSVAFMRASANGGSLVTLALVVTSGTPGCGFFSATLPTSETINNRNNV